eukprot:6826862-Lingulodinium_polyedra.AAC.1
MLPVELQARDQPMRAQCNNMSSKKPTHTLLGSGSLAPRCCNTQLYRGLQLQPYCTRYCQRITDDSWGLPALNDSIVAHTSMT